MILPFILMFSLPQCNLSDFRPWASASGKATPGAPAWTFGYTGFISVLSIRESGGGGHTEYAQVMAVRIAEARSRHNDGVSIYLPHHRSCSRFKYSGPSLPSEGCGFGLAARSRRIYVFSMNWYSTSHWIGLWKCGS
jgi:hypothetical protein